MGLTKVRRKLIVLALAMVAMTPQVQKVLMMSWESQPYSLQVQDKAGMCLHMSEPMVELIVTHGLCGGRKGLDTLCKG